jgi:peptide deformylase
MKKIIEAVISYAGITIAAASVGVIGGLVVVSLKRSSQLGTRPSPASGRNWTELCSRRWRLR